MTKMAFMPIIIWYKPLKIFSGTEWLMTLKLGMQHWWLVPIWWPLVDLDPFNGKVRLSHFCFCMGKKGETVDFYVPAYSKNSRWALSITPVSPVRLSVHPSVRQYVPLRVWAITPKPYGIYSWNVTGAYITLRRCVMNKEDNSCIFGFWIISAWLSSI